MHTSQKHIEWSNPSVLCSEILCPLLRWLPRFQLMALLLVSHRVEEKLHGKSAHPGPHAIVLPSFLLAPGSSLSCTIIPFCSSGKSRPSAANTSSKAVLHPTAPPATNPCLLSPSQQMSKKSYAPHQCIICSYLSLKLWVFINYICTELKVKKYYKDYYTTHKK